MRKAMNLGTIESVSSDDDWGLGGIGESSNTQFLSAESLFSPFVIPVPRHGNPVTCNALFPLDPRVKPEDDEEKKQPEDDKKERS